MNNGSTWPIKWRHDEEKGNYPVKEFDCNKQIWLN